MSNNKPTLTKTIHISPVIGVIEDVMITSSNPVVEFSTKTKTNDNKFVKNIFSFKIEYFFWKQQSYKIQEYLEKGSRFYFEFVINNYAWNGKNYSNVVISNMEFLGKGSIQPRDIEEPEPVIEEDVLKEIEDDEEIDWDLEF